MKRLLLFIVIFTSAFTQSYSQESTKENVEKKESFLELNGFFETRGGFRTQDDPNQKDASIGEVRLQLETEKQFKLFSLNIIGDFIYDPVMDIYTIDLESGEGFFDLRQLNTTFSPFQFMDVKMGRQVLTWGTGDLIFINDLFAKDWNSFLIGRDDEYLKAPTDAIKTSLFFKAFNADVIYTPKFGADRYIDGQRVSFFDRGSNRFRGRENPVIENRPPKWFEDDELAVRVYRTIKAYELAFYYYNGYWKSPAGIDFTSSNATFPRLDVYGFSIRGPFLKGILNIENGYYKSADGAANNPFIRNNEYRFLIGFEKEIAKELTINVQYNLERKLNYNSYTNNLPIGALRDKENRHLFTIRLTKLLMQQNLKLSLFNFYSPSDKDGYLRLNTSYKVSDSMKIEMGTNLFYGKEDYTFFGQFEHNSNIYVAVRYEF